MKYYEVIRTEFYTTYYNEEGECVDYEYAADGPYGQSNEERWKEKVVRRFARMKDAKNFIAEKQLELQQDKEENGHNPYVDIQYSMEKVELR